MSLPSKKSTRGASHPCSRAPFGGGPLRPQADGMGDRPRPIAPLIAAMALTVVWVPPARAHSPDGGVAVADAGQDGGDPWHAVAQRISSALSNERSLAKDTFQVSVSGLLVTLRGKVRTRAEAKRAVEVARQTADPSMMVYDGLTVENGD
jgi:hypothetical protein